MPSGRQNITFSFQGDSTGLRQAVNAAIQDLERYTAATRRATNNNTTSGAISNIGSTMSSIQRRFNELVGTLNSVASNKTMDRFNEKFQQTSQIVDQITQKFQNFGDNAFDKSGAEATAFISTLQKVDDMFGRLENSEVITGNTVNAFSTNLGKLNAALTENATVLTNSVTSNHRFAETFAQLRTRTQDISERFRNMFRPFNESASNFAQTLNDKVLNKLRGLIASAKSLSTQNKETAGETASTWQKVSNTFGDVRQEIERLTYKSLNYARVQKEIARNQAQHEASLQKHSNWESNGRKGREPKIIDLSSEDDIINKMVNQRVGTSIWQYLKNVLGKVPNYARGLKQISTTLFQALGESGRAAVDALKNVGSALSQAGSRIASFATNANVATVGLRGFASIAKSLPSIFGVIASQILQISFSNFLADATQQSIALVENLNLFTVAMGKAADEAQNFVDRMSDLYGMNPSNLYRYAGYFAQITGAIGLTDEAAMKLSTSMTKMSNDIASLYNVEIEQVVENLGSGLQGLNQAVRKYGIDMRQTTIQQTAYKYGLTENVRTMSEANRVVLRYLTMVEQMRNAIKQTTTDFDGANKVIGDFARNIETPANQLRIFKEQIQQLATAIGTFLIPIVQRLLPILNGVVMALRMILQFFATLFGIDSLTWGGEVSTGFDEAADSIEGVGDAAADAAKKVKDFTLPFDELHIINDKDLGGTANDLSDWGTLDPRLLEALEALQLALDDIDMAAKRVRDSILAIFGLTPNLELIPKGFLDNLIDLWKKADWEGFGAEIAKFLNQGIDWALQNLTWEKFEGAITDFLDRITGIFNGFIKYFDWYGLGNIGANLTNILFHTIEEAIRRVEWDILGYQLSRMINGFVENVDWDLVGRTLSEGLNAAFRIFLGFATGLNYDAIANAIVTGLNAAIRTIEPEVFGEAFGRMMNGMIKILSRVANELNFSEFIDKLYGAIARAIYVVQTKFEGDTSGWYALGNSITTGLSRIFEGLNAAIHKWGDMGISQALFDFLQGAIDGINWAALKESIDLILNGIIGFFTSFRERFDVREMITTFVLWLGDVIKGIHLDELAADISGFVSDFIGGIVDAFKIQQKTQGGNLIHEFFEFVSNIFTNFPWGDIGYLIGNWVGELIAHIIDFFTSAAFVDFVFGFARGVFDAFQQHLEAWKVIEDWIATFFVGIFLGLPPQLAAPIATFVAWLAGTIRNNITEFFQGIGDWVKGFFENLIGIIIQSFGDLIAKLPGKLGEIGKTISDYGTEMRKKGHELMDNAFQGIFTSMDTNGPEIPKKFSKTAQEMIDTADKKFTQLPPIIEKHYSNVSEVSRKTLSEMQSFLSQKLDEMQLNTNQSLTAIVADVEGNWHQLQITNETTWKDIYTTIKTEMNQSKEEVDARTEEIKTTMINKIQYALDHIADLEWEETGVKGVKKLKGGFETEWGNFEVYVDSATGQIVQLIENTLDSPSYSILAGNLVNTFSGAFNSIGQAASSTLGTIQKMWDSAKSFASDIFQAGKTATDYFNEMMERHSAAQNLAKQTQDLAKQAASAASSAASAASSAAKSASSANNSGSSSGGFFSSNSSSSFGSTALGSASKAGSLAYYQNGIPYYYNADGSIGSKWNAFYGKYMATGGVVTGPTNAIIGEAGRAEAVIPLDQSPQMRAFAQEVSQAVTGAITQTPGGAAQQPIDLTVKVQVGEKEWNAFVYESAIAGEREVGANPVEVRS